MTNATDIAESDIDLLLIGKTGNGKSALGNAILKRPAFESYSSCESITTWCNFDYASYKGRDIKLVDGPGVGDTRLDTKEGIKLVVREMEFAMAANTRGYHAFLLVIKFGGRFGRDDVDTIDILKKISGQNFVRDNCILVMTYGDEFERQMLANPSKALTFSEWCSNQSGIFKQLLGEVDNRIILFDNSTNDEAKQDAQIDRLLQMVDNLKLKGARYTDGNFMRAQASRQRAVVESGKPEMREKVNKQTALILQDLDIIRKRCSDDEQILQDLDIIRKSDDEQIRLMEKLLQSTKSLQAELQKEDQGTEALFDLVQSVSAVEYSIKDSIRVQTNVQQERTKMEETERRIRLEMEEQMKSQKDEFDMMVYQHEISSEERIEIEKKQAREYTEKIEALKAKQMELENKLMAQLESERQRLEEKTNELQKAHDQSKKRQGLWSRFVGWIQDTFS